MRKKMVMNTDRNLETLKITLEIDDRRSQGAPAIDIVLGINRISSEHHFHIFPGRNTIKFSEAITHRGEQCLIMDIKQKDSRPLTGMITMTDLKIHGVSVGTYLYNCTYHPTEDGDGVPGGIVLNNHGRWLWPFHAPISENAGMKVGLW